jgi:hypothetical protein
VADLADRLGVIAALRDEADRARAWPEPWPRTQPMPFAVAGGVAQPWRHRAVAEYDKARGTVTEQRHGSHGLYTAAQVNRAIGWWNERAARLGRSAGGS